MNKMRPARSLLVWSFFIVLSGITLVLTSSAFSEENSAETSAEIKEPVVEDKQSERPATVQEPASVEETTIVEQVEQTEEALKIPDPSKKPTESPDVFNPSEEISEDFAVAFPVDI